jgi:hypothetical protein
MAKDRSVATDALEVMGRPIPDDLHVGRDAVHLGTFTATCAEKVYPGTHVAALTANTVDPKGAKKVGIVDPFLNLPVNPGKKFLVLMYPRSLASLNHVWSHPDVPDEPAKERIVYRDAEEEDFDDSCRLCYE